MSLIERPGMPRARRARRIAVVTAVLLLASAVTAAAHDMFVQPARFFVREKADALVRILNGTSRKARIRLAVPGSPT
jgi:hypothetical protein